MLARPNALPADINRLIASAEEILQLQPNEGLQLARHAHTQAQLIGYLHGEVRAGLALGRAQLILELQAAALITLQQALAIAEPTSLEKVNLLEQVARCHLNLGDTLQAAQLWKQCAQISLEHKHFTPFIHAQIGLGQVHFGFDEFEDALKYNYQAFDYLYTSSDAALRCRVYLNIVMNLYSLKRFCDAETMLQRARDLSLTLRNLDNETEVYRLTGLLLLAKNKIEDARTHFAIALKICLLQENPWHKAMSLLGLGYCHLAEERWDEAHTQLNEAHTVAMQLQNPHLLCKTHHALIRACEGKKEYAAAKTHELAYSQQKKHLQRP
jgi:tetratricopeptide (TPR) repeat protein